MTTTLRFMLRIMKAVLEQQQERCANARAVSVHVQQHVDIERKTLHMASWGLPAKLRCAVYVMQHIDC